MSGEQNSELPRWVRHHYADAGRSAGAGADLSSDDDTPPPPSVVAAAAAGGAPRQGGPHGHQQPGKRDRDADPAGRALTKRARVHAHDESAVQRGAGAVQLVPTRVQQQPKHQLLLQQQPQQPQQQSQQQPQQQQQQPYAAQSTHDHYLQQLNAYEDQLRKLQWQQRHLMEQQRQQRQQPQQLDSLPQYADSAHPRHEGREGRPHPGFDARGQLAHVLARVYDGTAPAAATSAAAADAVALPSRAPQRRPRRASAAAPQPRKMSRALRNAFYNDTVVCGVDESTMFRWRAALDLPPTSAAHGCDPEMTVADGRVMRFYSPWFNCAVGVFFALNANDNEPYFRASAVAKRLGISNNSLSMQLARRKLEPNVGVIQARDYVHKEHASFAQGLKAGSYFIAARGCRLMADYYGITCDESERPFLPPLESGSSGPSPATTSADKSS